MPRKTILTAAPVLALIVGALMISGSPGSTSLTPVQAASQAAYSAAPQTDIAARLAALHKRAVERSATDADDHDSQIENPELDGVAPEEAATLARGAAGGGLVRWIVRRNDSKGNPYYHIRLDTSHGDAKHPVRKFHVDARTGSVSDGSHDLTEPGEPDSD